MSRPSKAAAAEAADTRFGDALGQLQRVVGEMESDDLPLETLLARYEEGMKLVRVCEAKLAAAEVRIQQLEKNAAGEAVLKPLPGAQAPASE
jgi:exodeoxyribonuclease VII small subunit